MMSDQSGSKLARSKTMQRQNSSQKAVREAANSPEETFSFQIPSNGA
jgi:hypothetical protein